MTRLMNPDSVRRVLVMYARRLVAVCLAIAISYIALTISLSLKGSAPLSIAVWSAFLVGAVITIALHERTYPDSTRRRNTRRRQQVSTAPSDFWRGDQVSDVSSGPAKSLFAFPLESEGKPVGTLQIEMPADRSLSPEQHDAVYLVAQQLVRAIENAQLLEEVRRSAARERLVYEITSKINRSVDTAGILKTATDELKRAIQAADVQITIPSPRSSEEETVQPPSPSSGSETKK